VCVLRVAACETARLPESAGMGPDPALPPPVKTLIPTVHIAPAKGWPEGVKPTEAPGTSVTAFAAGLEHPRWVYALPNGDVLVAETNAPPRPEEGKGIKGRVMALVKKRAGAAAPSANRIRLLRDADGDGVAEARFVFLEGLNSPFGMALVGNDFYMANTDAVLRFPYTESQTRITVPGVKVVDLPAGTRNHHWTKNLIAVPSGSWAVPSGPWAGQCPSLAGYVTVTGATDGATAAGRRSCCLRSCYPVTTHCSMRSRVSSRSRQAARIALSRLTVTAQAPPTVSHR
jgi:glucose/arabinose dehydrogenase